MTIQGIKKIWLPLLVVAFAGFQTFGIDGGRSVPVRRTADSLESLLPSDSSVAIIKDSVTTTGIDSLSLLTDSVRTSRSDSISGKADSLDTPTDCSRQGSR